jgi:hypothetical protein
MLSVKTKNFTDFLIQILYIITISLLTKSAKIIQILANLRGRHHHPVTQIIGGNALNAFLQQFSQITVISWHTTDDSL